MITIAAMAKRELGLQIRTAAMIVICAGLSIAALSLADRTLGKRGLAALRWLQALTHLPELPLGQTATRPALYRGTLHTEKPRTSPSGHASAIWYAWVEDVRGSGKSSYVVTVCSRQATTELELRQAARTARLDLIDDDDQNILLKGGALEMLRPNRVALDFGPLHQSRFIPPPMRELCDGSIPPGGNLTYFEAHVPLDSPVTILGCLSADALQRCEAPRGVVTVRGLGPVLRAYANGNLEGIRSTAAFVGIALSLLASVLFKLRGAAGGRS